MSTRYHVLHTTEYRYGFPVQTARHILHLSPRVCSWQEVEQQTLDINPTPAGQSSGRDSFGNPLTRIELTQAHQFLHVSSAMTLSVGPRPWLSRLDHGPRWEAVRDAMVYGSQAVSEPTLEALAMRFESPGVRVKRELELWAAPSFAPGRPIIDAARDLMGRIFRDFRYDPKATEVGTSVMEVLEKKHGVCQDFAHLMIGGLRALGLSARYVSGYLRTDPPAGQPRLIGADASHAWVAVYVPDIGWVEFDPTNDCLADERYLILGWGRDFGDVSPIRGVIQGGGEHELDVGVTVTPLDEFPGAVSSCIDETVQT